MKTPMGKAFMLGMLVAFIAVLFTYGDDVKEGRREPLHVMPAVFIGGLLGLLIEWLSR